MTAPQVLYVVSNVDPKGKFNLVTKNEDPRALTGRDMKRKIKQVTGIPEERQLLKFKGRVVEDWETGYQLGITSGETIVLEAVAPGPVPVARPPPRPPQQRPPPPPPPPPPVVPPPPPRPGYDQSALPSLVPQPVPVAVPVPVPVPVEEPRRMPWDALDSPGTGKAPRDVPPPCPQPCGPPCMPVCGPCDAPPPPCAAPMPAPCNPPPCPPSPIRSMSPPPPPCAMSAPTCGPCAPMCGPSGGGAQMQMMMNMNMNPQMMNNNGMPQMPINASGTVPMSGSPLPSMRSSSPTPMNSSMGMATPPRFSSSPIPNTMSPQMNTQILSPQSLPTMTSPQHSTTEARQLQEMSMQEALMKEGMAPQQAASVAHNAVQLMAQADAQKVAQQHGMMMQMMSSPPNSGNAMGGGGGNNGNNGQNSGMGMMMGNQNSMGSPPMGQMSPMTPMSPATQGTMSPMANGGGGREGMPNGMGPPPDGQQSTSPSSPQQQRMMMQQGGGGGLTPPPAAHQNSQNSMMIGPGPSGMMGNSPPQGTASSRSRSASNSETFDEDYFSKTPPSALDYQTIKMQKSHHKRLKHEHEALRHARDLDFLRSHRELEEMRLKSEIDVAKLEREIKAKEDTISRLAKKQHRASTNISKLKQERGFERKAECAAAAELDERLAMLDDASEQARQQELESIKRRLREQTDFQQMLAAEKLRIDSERREKRAITNEAEKQLHSRVQHLKDRESALEKEWEEIEERRRNLEKPIDEVSESKPRSKPRGMSDEEWRFLRYEKPSGDGSFRSSPEVRRRRSHSNSVVGVTKDGSDASDYSNSRRRRHHHDNSNNNNTTRQSTDQMSDEWVDTTQTTPYKNSTSPMRPPRGLRNLDDGIPTWRSGSPQRSEFSVRNNNHMSPDLRSFAWNDERGVRHVYEEITPAP